MPVAMHVPLSDSGQVWRGCGPLGLDECESPPSLEDNHFEVWQFDPYEACELASAGAVCEFGGDDD
jgi:hypothetical protein